MDDVAELLGWTIAAFFGGAVIAFALVDLTPLGLVFLAANDSFGFWALAGGCAGSVITFFGGIWAGHEARNGR